MQPLHWTSHGTLHLTPDPGTLEQHHDVTAAPAPPAALAVRGPNSRDASWCHGDGCWGGVRASHIGKAFTANMMYWPVVDPQLARQVFTSGS